MTARAASAGSGSELVAVGDGWRDVLAEITVGVGAEDREPVLGAQVAGQARAQRYSAKVICATGVDAAAQHRQPIGQRPEDEERRVCSAGCARVRYGGNATPWESRKPMARGPGVRDGRWFDNTREFASRASLMRECPVSARIGRYRVSGAVLSGLPRAEARAPARDAGAARVRRGSAGSRGRTAAGR